MISVTDIYLQGVTPRCYEKVAGRLDDVTPVELG
jgi:hypothetical protein